MVTWEEISREAVALPDVAEGTHFGLPSFKVQEKVFVVLQKGNTHAIVHVDEPLAKAAASDDPGTYEAIWRNPGRIFVGVRVELARGSTPRVLKLVRAAWRNKAPKRLVKLLDGPA